MKNNSVEVNNIADIQSLSDHRNLAIAKVGVKGVFHPITFCDKSLTCNTHAKFNLYVDLPKAVRGTHMSRFIEFLHSVETPWSIQSLPSLALELRSRFKQAATAYVEMEFRLFVTKEAPMSKVKSLLDYPVTLGIKLAAHKPQIYLKLQVPATSLCPCSKEISQYGAHNQRSHIIINAEVTSDVWLEDLIALAEQEASCDLYGILKRADEKYVTEHAYLNPKFVEDMVRDVALGLNENRAVQEYTVEVENFESIHNHSAYALLSSKE